MIYTPKNNISHFGEGAAAGAAIGTAVPGIGNVVGGLIGGAVDIVGSLLGKKKSQWSENSDDQNEKLVTTLLFDGIWNKKLGYYASEPLYKYVWQTLFDNGVFTGKEQSYEAWWEGNKDWIPARAYALRGLGNDGDPAKAWSPKIYGQFKNFVLNGISNTPTLAEYNQPSLTDDIILPQTQQAMDFSKSPATTTPNKPLSEMTAAEIAALTPAQKLTLEKKAKTKKILISEQMT